MVHYGKIWYLHFTAEIPWILLLDRLHNGTLKWNSAYLSNFLVTWKRLNFHSRAGERLTQPTIIACPAFLTRFTGSYTNSEALPVCWPEVQAIRWQWQGLWKARRTNHPGFIPLIILTLFNVISSHYYLHFSIGIVIIRHSFWYC